MGGKEAGGERGLGSRIRPCQNAPIARADRAILVVGKQIAMRSNVRVALLIYSLSAVFLTAGGSVAEEAPMRFRSAGNGGNCSTCAWIAAEGRIERDTAQKLEAFLKAEGIEHQPTIALHSSGGDLAGGLRLGEFIRAHRLDTTVLKTEFGTPGSADWWDSEADGICASACAYAFLGGVQRTVPEGSRLGVHQFRSVDGTSSESGVQEVTAVLAAYLIHMEVSRDLLVPAGLSRSEEIYWLNRHELENLNVVTDRSAIDETDWQLQESGGKISLWVLQPQSDGLSGIFMLSCSPDPTQYLFIWAMDLVGRDDALISDIALMADGLSFQIGGRQSSMNYAPNGTRKDTTVFFGSAVPRAMILSLAVANDPVELNLDLPHAIASPLGWSHPMPRSNLKRLLPILDRNC